MKGTAPCFDMNVQRRRSTASVPGQDNSALTPTKPVKAFRIKPRRTSLYEPRLTRSLPASEDAWLTRAEPAVHRPSSVTFDLQPIIHALQDQNLGTPVSSRCYGRPVRSVACIDIGSTYCSAGIGLEYLNDTTTYRILDKWPVCKHCPQNDTRRLLSQAVLNGVRGDLIAVGYDAHMRYLNSNSRQRKNMILLPRLSDVLFDAKLPHENVSNGDRAVEADYFTASVAIMKHFRDVISTEIECLVSVGNKPPTWTVTIPDESQKNKMARILATLNMIPYRIIKRSDAVFSFLASTEISRSSPAKPSVVPDDKAFFSLHVGSAKTEVAYVTVNGSVAFPKSKSSTYMGGNVLTNALHKIIRDIFGDKMLRTYEAENHEGHTDLLCAIEKAKRNLKPNQDLVIHVPFSFGLHFARKSKGKLSDHPSRMGFAFNPIDNSVTIPFRFVTKIFVDFVEKIATVFREILKTLPPRLTADGVPVYLTGGTSENELFRRILSIKLGGYDIVPAPESCFASLLGALKGELEPEKTPHTMQSLYTIAVTAARHRDTGTSRSSMGTISDPAEYYDALIPFIRKYDYLREKDHTEVLRFFAAAPEQENINVQVFFMSTGKEETLFDDCMEKVAQLQLQIPPEKRGVATGQLFVFEIVLKFESNPESVLIAVRDLDHVFYGTARVVRTVVC